MSRPNFDLVNAGVTFKNIPIYKLHNFSFKDVQTACEEFKKLPDVSECVIVQTASRVEIFLVINLETDDAPDARRTEGKELAINQITKTWQSLTDLNQFDLDHFDQTLEVYKNTDVYYNLLRLACGLDSVVVGKEEIFEELKSTISNAKLAKVSGPILNKLFDSTIRIARTIRDSTGISKDVMSLGELSLKLVEEKTSLEKKKVLLIGTGESAARVGKALNKKGIDYEVTSQTIERATGFANILGGKPIEFEEVLKAFDKFDIIFVATTSDYYLINYETLKYVMKTNKNGSLILDVSEPKAVDQQISTLPGVKLMFRDQISEIADESVRATQAKVPAVEKLIDKEAPILEATINRIDAEPVVRDVVESIDSIRKKELEKAIKELGETDESKIKILEELTKKVVNNIVSVPVHKQEKESDKEN